MSYVARFAWPIQIAIFLLLFIFLPHSAFRLFIIFGYILVSVISVRYIRKVYS